VGEAESTNYITSEVEMVSVFWLAPVGEVNLMAWVEVALIVRFDIVSDAFVTVAAKANLNGTVYKRSARTVARPTVLYKDVEKNNGFIVIG
jgi:hypothetical protein